ncbi:hypothetical protein ACIP98_40800 [Streptomyces sp. NPDC088354]|uniref:hypothetical protein n=1 Tax=Streptomyces sp. NPDC088354 TaxID=3365856 RepID=UPI003802298A
MKDEKRSWRRPADGSWWRFVPRSRWTGILSIVAGALLVVEMIVALINHPSPGAAVFSVLLGLVGCALIVSTVHGLRVLNQNERH